MRKKFTTGISIVLLAIALCLNLVVNPNLERGNAMTLSMKNIEAIADPEGGTWEEVLCATCNWSENNYCEVTFEGTTYSCSNMRNK